MITSFKLLVFIFCSLIILGGCRQIFGDRTEPETIIGTSLENSTILVTSPLFASIWKPGESLKIRWIATSIRKIDIQLFRKNNYQFTIIENIENTGSFDWLIPTDINISNHYKVKIINHSNPEVYKLSDRFGIQN